MDKQQIAFIICTNNPQYYNECVLYINDLYIPDGYSIDIICIQDADSMASGYNGGMQASTAKYKIYLHHDTFILNRNLISDILAVFLQNADVGMIGVLGSVQLPSDANCYLSWTVGNVFAYSGEILIKSDLYQPERGSYLPVAAIDGMILITQYDLPWREDFLDGWDFYDISQSLEMRKHGYKVVIPYQETPWCYHDCGPSKLQNYDFYRKQLLQMYPETFTSQTDEAATDERQQLLTEAEKIRNSMIQIFEHKAYDSLYELLPELRLFANTDRQLCEIINLMEIYAAEKDSSSEAHSYWFRLNDWDIIFEQYTLIRFILLRAGYEREDTRIDELRELVQKQDISQDAIRNISRLSLGDIPNVLKTLF